MRSARRSSGTARSPAGRREGRGRSAAHAAPSRASAARAWRSRARSRRPRAAATAPRTCACAKNSSCMPTCVRRARSIPGGRFENIDLVVVRENLEGLYIGHEHYIQIGDDPHAVAIATRRQHPPRQPTASRVRFRACDRHRPQESHHRPQSQHHEGADRHLSRDRRRISTSASTRAASRWTRSSSMPAR